MFVVCLLIKILKYSSFKIYIQFAMISFKSFLVLGTCNINNKKAIVIGSKPDNKPEDVLVLTNHFF